MARGTGIKVVNKWSQIPKSRPLIVQHYIAKPHLINHTKYDLRIYVLVTSLNPLRYADICILIKKKTYRSLKSCFFIPICRIYLYDEGLVRFASNKYTHDNKSLSDVFMHLTNYSINKNSSTYLPNEDPEKREGHKWTLAALWQHFAENGIDSKTVWDRIKDMVIKTIISAEHTMQPLARQNLGSHYSGYELFGFDVLLDHDLKPWLIEVNISPSLHSSSPLDLEIKSPLATEVFNIARYHVPNKISSKAQKQILAKLGMDSEDGQLCLDPRLYRQDLSKADRNKHNRVLAVAGNKNEYVPVALDKLTPDDVRHLIRAEDELAQLTHFSRIYPTQDSSRYFKYFQTPRYYNFLFDAWEFQYADCRAAAIDRLELLCQEKVHLRVPAVINHSLKAVTTLDVSVLKAPTPKEQNESVTSLPTTAAEGSSSSLSEGSLALNPSPSNNTLSNNPCSSSSSTNTTTATTKRLGVVSKPLHVKPCSSPVAGSSYLSCKKPKVSTTTSSSLKSSSTSSPEPMSVESASSDNNKSRTPSPVPLAKRILLEGGEETATEAESPPSSSITPNKTDLSCSIIQTEGDGIAPSQNIL